MNLSESRAHGLSRRFLARASSFAEGEVSLWSADCFLLTRYGLVLADEEAP